MSEVSTKNHFISATFALVVSRREQSLKTMLNFTTGWKKAPGPILGHETCTKVGYDKDSFITQDRNDDFECGQVESTFSRGPCDLTSGTNYK